MSDKLGKIQSYSLNRLPRIRYRCMFGSTCNRATLERNSCEKYCRSRLALSSRWNIGMPGNSPCSLKASLIVAGTSPILTGAVENSRGPRVLSGFTNITGFATAIRYSGMIAPT